MVEQLTIEAQEAVNELWAEEAIPFKLTADSVETGAPGYYTVHFLDARFRALFIYWNPGEGSFKTAVREAGGILSGEGRELRLPARACKYLDPSVGCSNFLARKFN